MLWSRRIAKVATGHDGGDAAAQRPEARSSIASESAGATAEQRTIPPRAATPTPDASASPNAPAITSWP